MHCCKRVVQLRRKKKKNSLPDLKKTTTIRQSLTITEAMSGVTCQQCSWFFFSSSVTSKSHCFKFIFTPALWLPPTDLKDRPPPIIRQGPSNQTQVLGGVTLLKCQANGDPEPTVSWRKNGASLLGKDPRFSLLDHGSLQIQNTRVSERDYITIRKWTSANHVARSWSKKNTLSVFKV